MAHYADAETAQLGELQCFKRANRGIVAMVPSRYI